MKKRKSNRTYIKSLIDKLLFGLVIIFLFTIIFLVRQNHAIRSNDIVQEAPTQRHGIFSLMLVGKDGLSEEISYEHVIIKVEAPAGAFPEGTELRIIPITQESEKREIKEKLAKLTEVTEDSETISFDISFIGWDENGNEIELDPAEGKTVKISINYKNNDKFSNIDESNDRELKIYHLEEKTDEEGNKTDGVEIEEVVINHEESCKGELVADANKFSVYTVADVESPSLRAAMCTVTFQNGHCYFQSSEDDGTCTFDMPTSIEVECGSTISRQDIDEPNHCNATSNYSSSQGYNYYFARWATTANPGYNNTSYNYNFSSQVNSNITLYAIGSYSHQNNGTNNYSCTATFNANGGTLTSPSSVIYGDYGLVKQPTDPIYTGYMLNCWTTSQNGSCSNAYNFNSTTNLITDNTTFYAQWTPFTYTIAFNAGNVNGQGSTSSITASYNIASYAPENGFSLTGYTFVGWNDKSDGSGTGYQPGDTLLNLTGTNNATVTLYAQWLEAVTVTFNSNGGSAIASQIVGSGLTATMPEDPKYSGYKFLGWYLTGSNTAFNFSTPITQDITLYAKWEETDTLTVTFETNGGTGVSDQEVNYGERAVKPTDPTKSNQLFKYWSTDSQGNNEYNFNTPVTSDLILYAQWANTCTVTFQNGNCYYNTNSATCTFTINPTTVTVPCGTPVSRPADPASPITVRISNRSRTIYFSRWSITSNPGNNNTSNNWNFDDPITASRTLYAIGTNNSYTVTFNANGGVLAGDSSQEVEILGNYGIARKPEDPTRTGYDFKWWSQQNSTSEYNFTTQVTSNITLVAQWTPIEYTIKYNANGGTGTMMDTDMTYDTSANLRTNTFTKSNATFSGWNTRADGVGTSYGNGVSVSNLTDVPGRRVYLYAQWNCNEGYHDDNGACVSDICEFLGQTIADGSGLVVYSTSSPTCPTICTTGIVTCTNGVLGGDTGYTNLTCAPVSTTCDASFTLNSTGANGTYDSCTPYTANGNSCTPGTTLYKLESCNSGYTQVGDTCKQNCTLNGQNIPHGSGILVYSESLEMCPDQCLSETRICNDGILSGSYTNTNCTVAPVSCSGGLYPFTTCPTNGICTQSCTPYTVNNNSCTIGTVRWQLNGCDNGYHSEDGESCTGNTKQVQCTEGSRPANSSYVYRMVQISRQGQRNNGNWSTADDCAWTCNEHFHTGANNESCERDIFDIIWLNSDGTTLETDTGVAYGSMPSYDGEIPTSGGNVQYTYTFSGWSPEISVVTGDITYTATYSSTVNQYTVIFEDEDGTEISSAEYDYGTIAADIVKPADPTKAADVQYTYTFAGWSPAVGEVTGDITYTATYSSTVNKYTVIFEDEDGTEISNAKYDYGTIAADIVKPADPTKAADVQYTYTFAGWSPTVGEVTGDITYTATYSSTVNKYTVIFEDEDGTEISRVKYDYGTIAADIVKPADPTKAADVQYTYTFAGWSPAVRDVTGDITYIATYSSTLNQYTATIIAEPEGYGTVSPTKVTKNYNSNITINDNQITIGGTTVTATPTASGAQYTYTFSSWVNTCGNDGTKLTGDCTITAQFERTTNEYIITFYDRDGGMLRLDMVEYGDTPEYSGANPVKQSDEDYVYEFIGWSPNILPVTGDMDYVAVYESYAIPHINFVSPTPINNAEITGNRFTAKMEITNIEDIKDITYEINGKSIRLEPEYGYNFDNIVSIGEERDVLVKSIIGDNDGLVHGATRVNNGRYGGAYRFDGINDYIELSESNSLRGAVIELWAKANGGEWTHIIYIKQRTEWCYVNGMYESTLPEEYENIFDKNKTIGRNGDGYFSGEIDEVKVYRRDISMEDATLLYKTHLNKPSVGKIEVEIENTCLDQSGAYEYIGSVSAEGNILTSTGRNLRTQIPLINIEGTGYDFGSYETIGERRIITGTMGTLSVRDYIGKGGWRVYFTTSPALVGQETDQEISTENLKFKANNLIYNPLYEGVQNSLVGFGEGISTTVYNTAHGSTENDNILEYIVRETDENDFMCSEVGVYSDNTEIKLEVPAWQIEDNYNGTLWITLQLEGEDRELSGGGRSTGNSGNLRK